MASSELRSLLAYEMTEPDSIEQPIYYGRPVMKPTVGTWIKHLLLLGVTFCTATIAGTLFPFGRLDYLPKLIRNRFTNFFNC